MIPAKHKHNGSSYSLVSSALDEAMWGKKSSRSACPCPNRTGEMDHLIRAEILHGLGLNFKTSLTHDLYQGKLCQIIARIWDFGNHNLL